MINYSSVDQAADEIIRRTDGLIILATPLGLGKPNQLLNALYQKIKTNKKHSLTIYTALSLSKPSLAGKSELERRFLQPFLERVFGDYQELNYLQDLKNGALPSNVQVHEFFVQPGAFLKNTYVQQNYLSSNYTHVARDLNSLGVNVIAQMVAEKGGRYSLSCNPEITLDLYPLLQKRKQLGETILCVGQVHHHLPFMENSAEVSADFFDMIIDNKDSHQTLMSTPNMPVGMAEHFIGLNASALIKDGGTLQIGIGALGDAITHFIFLRHKNNAVYLKLLNESGIIKNFKKDISSMGDTAAFIQGLYGCSEMLTYGLLRLFKEGIIARAVDGDICLHGGFFLGPAALYDELKELPPEQRNKIDMTNISFVNHLYGSAKKGDELLKRQQRLQARFINTAFTVTLLGAVVSDQLEDGRVLSGVGGQYNFVAQAHELENARSIILVRSTRETAEGVQSNIVWNYAHTTVPRHLRDVVVTEYGIADLRGKSDSEIIAALLNITDSRFQQGLLKAAKVNGKISEDYRIPEQFLNNTPKKLEPLYKNYRASFPDFPLGSDFDSTEQELLKALTWLKAKAHIKNSATLLKGFFSDEKKYQPHLERMGLNKVNTIKERIFRGLLLAALAETKSPLAPL